MNVYDQTRLRQTAAQVCVIAALCTSITLPGIIISSNLPYFKTEQLLLPVAFAVYLWLLLAGVARKIRWNGLFLVGLCYTLTTLLSIWYGGDVLGHSVILRDFYELPKLWLPVAFFTLAYEAELSEESLRRLLIFFTLAILLVCLYAWSQWAGLGFASKLNPYYASPGHNQVSLQYGRRVFSTVGNANFLGQLMTWCVAAFLLAFLFRVGNRLFNAFAALACMVTLVMTASRFALLTVALAVVLIAGTLASLGRKGAAKAGMLFLLIPIFIWTYFTVAGSNKRTYERYQTLEHPLDIDSLRQRIDDLWPDELKDIKESPILGHGPAKAVFTLGYADTEYLGVIREKGILGFLPYLGYFLYPLAVIRKGRQAAKRAGLSFLSRIPATVFTLHLGYIMVILALVMNIPLGTFYTMQLQGFLWLWLGLSARAAKSIACVSKELALNRATQNHLSFQPPLFRAHPPVLVR